MRKCTSLLFGGLFVMLLAASVPAADVSVGLSLDKDGLQSFRLAIGEHFRAPEKEVVAFEKSVPDEELPVAYIIAGAAGVGVKAVVKLRLGGRSWLEVSAHYGLSPDIFYVPLARDPGPPYGKAWGHYKNKKGKGAKKFQMTDAEIVDWANLRFLSEYHRCSPDEIVKARKDGRNFMAISRELKNKNKKKAEKSTVATQTESKNKGKGKKK